MMCAFNQACVHKILNEKGDLCQLCIVPAFCLSLFLPHLFLLVLSFSPNSCSCQLFRWSTVAVLRCRSLKAISSSRVRLWRSHSHYPATGARGLHRMSITEHHTWHLRYFTNNVLGKSVSAHSPQRSWARLSSVNQGSIGQQINIQSICSARGFFFSPLNNMIIITEKICLKNSENI